MKLSDINKNLYKIVFSVFNSFVKSLLVFVLKSKKKFSLDGLLFNINVCFENIISLPNFEKDIEF